MDFKNAEWTEQSENIWKVSYPYSDAGIVVFNNGESWGYKKFGNNAMNQLQKDGDYYHNGSVLYLYSSENPAKKYDSIEIGSNVDLFKVQGKSIGSTDVYIDNISFKYTGAFGVRAQKADGLYITNCEFGWIGGSLQEGNIRYGNGIEFWDGQKNVTVENNWFYQIYDSGFTFQGNSSSNKYYKNIICNNNLFENNKMSFEFWHQDNGFTFENIQFNNNISRLAGYGQCEQTIDFWLAAHIYADYRTTGTVKNFTIQNNIFDTSKLYMAWMWLDTDSTSSNILGAHSISQNTYYHKRSAKSEAIYVGGYAYASSQEQLEKAVALFETNPKKVVWLGFDS